MTISADMLRGVKALIADVDGVLTDGSVFVGENVELKAYSVRDGLAIKLWQKAGFQFALLSGRASASTLARAAELGVTAVKTGRLDKQRAFGELLAELNLRAEETAYIGDDLTDLAPLQLAAVGFCPKDAAPEAVAAADIVAPCEGGRGAVRFAIESLLKAKGLWRRAVADFEAKHD